MQTPTHVEGKQNHIFVDNVRFWAMFSVVAVHCLQLATLGAPPAVHMSVLIPLGVPVKLGTIGFFLISGFLLGHRMQTSDPVEYMGRRAKVVFLPWLMWASLMVTDLCWHRRLEFVYSTERLHLLGRQVFAVVINSPFWFVPNLFLGMALLLLFRRYLYDLRLGGALLSMTLFYAANIYAHWVPSAHNEALFGFVFYLWLGSYASHRFEWLGSWLSRVPMAWMVAATIVAATCSYGEGRWIYHLHLKDPTNTLRLSNQVLSVVGVLTLMKVQRPTWPRFIDARRETFGVYLSHTLALELAGLGMSATVGRYAPALLTSRVGIVMLWPLVFVAVYGMALGMTKLLAGWGVTSWLVGVAAESKRPALRIREDLVRQSQIACESKTNVV